VVSERDETHTQRALRACWLEPWRGILSRSFSFLLPLFFCCVCFHPCRSLGCVLYELLTGRHAFNAPSLGELVIAIVRPHAAALTRNT